MKKCPNCGYKVDENERLCPNCRYDLQFTPIKKEKKPRSIRNIIIDVFAIAIFVGCLGLLGLDIVNSHRRVEQLEQIIPDRTEVTGSYDKIASQNPKGLDELLPFYNEFLNYVGQFPSEGEDDNTYTLYGDTISIAHLGAMITYKDYEFKASFTFNYEHSSRELIMTIPYIKSKGIDRNQLKAYCELTGIVESELFKVITDTVNDIGKLTSYWNSISYRDKEMKLSYGSSELKVYYPIQ